MVVTKNSKKRKLQGQGQVQSSAATTSATSVKGKDEENSALPSTVQSDNMEPVAKMVCKC